MVSTNTGTSAIDPAISPIRSKRSGVIEAPTATPRIVRIDAVILPKLAIGTRSWAAIRQAKIGPSRTGRGRWIKSAIATPIAATVMAISLGLSRIIRANSSSDS